ncbi:MAG TPA: HAD family hydrolase [Gammaproteobacteria bacterium]|nr:HAD family hydrolase [Gammaproteobacteria bacterium]
MAIRLITFDLDDTLWECASVISAAEHVFYGWLGRHYPRITQRLEPEALVHHRRTFFKTCEALSHDVTSMRKQWLKKLAREFEYPEDLVEPGFRVFWEHRNAVTLFDDASDLLPELKQSYTVGAITNGNADVHYIGVGHLFDFVVNAAEAGAAKPSPVIFNQALQHAGISADDAVHVGDDPVTDVRGANEAGMRTVWFNPERGPWPSGPRPDAEIASLPDLKGVLERWRQR